MIGRAIAWKDVWHLLRDFASALGFVTILTTICDFFPDLRLISDSIKSVIGLSAVVAGCALYAFVRNWPKSRFEFKIKNRDACVELKIGNIFKHKGSIVVPVNSAFDMRLNGTVKTSKSVQSVVVQKYFQANAVALTKKIERELRSSIYDSQRTGSTYRVGTTVCVKSDKRQEHPFYFVANSHINSDGARVQANDSDLPDALSGLWSFLSEHGAKGDIAIPLLGTGHGRLSLTREDVYKEIARSFVASCSGKIYSNKLTIFIRPEDIERYKISVRELIEFTKFQALYVDFSPTSSTRTGEPVSS
jgi:Domain of unknown function (DUF6430)